MAASISKIQRVCRHFAQMPAVLCCPICRQPLKLAEQQGSLRCPQGHCYDLAAQNYLNLAPQRRQTADKYTSQLFSARRQVFQAGLYQPLLQRLLARLQPCLPAGRPWLLLDAGCGEGFFAASLLDNLSPQAGAGAVYGVDLAKSAIQMAAKGPVRPGLYWLISDLANLPLPDNSVDILLNLLSPANYREFLRVLRPGGLLIKVSPGPHYLQEVRRALQIPKRPPDEQQQVFSLWQQALPNAAASQLSSLTYQRPLTPELAAAFLQMSPLTFNHQTSDGKADFQQITIDLHLLSAII